MSTANGSFFGVINFTKSNPDYLALLTAAAGETDPTLKQNILNKIAYTSPLSRDEQEVFEYVYFDYIMNNPSEGEYVSDSNAVYVLENYMVDGYVINTVDSSFTAYVGEYYNNNGETT